MKQIKIINTYAADDLDFSSDASNVELQVDGVRVMDGDDYHDKIDDQIEGFIKAMDWFNIPYTKEETNQNEEGCDDEDGEEDEEDEDEE